MIKTIIKWDSPAPFTDAEIEQLKISAEALAGAEYRLGDLAYEQNGNLTVTRLWPSLETAQAWLDHIAPWNPLSTEIVTV